MKILNFFIILIFCVFSSNSEVLKMKSEPIKSRISFKQLNRISVKNDRIESVSGLDAAFHFEKNEKTGDGYIRPTEENGHESIAISLTTVSGVTQELILSVDDGEPNVLILENTEAQSEIISENYGVSSASDYETSVVEAMKKLVAGDSVFPIKLAVKPSKTVPGFSVKFVESYKLGGFIGHKFEVSGKSNVVTELKESDFCEDGDLALSFSELDLFSGKPVFLYVLTHE